jgi:hypothetical protein
VEKLTNSLYCDLFQSNTKFLGLFIDENLKWQYHLDYIKSKLRKAIFGIRKITEVADTKTAIITYYALFHSILSYGLVIWGNCPYFTEIFILQKKAVRAIKGVNHNTSCKPYFKELGIMTLPSLYIYETVKYVKKNLMLFTTKSQIHDHFTRSRDHLYSSKNSLAVSQNDIYFIGPKFYNKLPESLRLLPYEKFKVHVKHFLVNNVYYSIEEFCL